MASTFEPGLAAIRYRRGDPIDDLMRQVVRRLCDVSFVLGGLMQERDGRHFRVVDIRTGRAAPITEDRGRDARGCRLVPDGLLGLACCVDDAILAKVDLIVINRFGRAESEGRGFLSSFAEAVSAGIPVLTAVRDPYFEAWQAFHDGLATELPSSLDEILRWCFASRRGQRAFAVDVERGARDVVTFPDA